MEKQGFIHCSYPSQIVKVADANYLGRKDLLLLCIESNRVHADIREEGAGDESYPHVFGPLNLDSVTKVLAFEPDKSQVQTPAWSSIISRKTSWPPIRRTLD